MNYELKTVTIRIANSDDGRARAWSDDLPGLSLSCESRDVLFRELTPCVTDLLSKQGLDSKMVREIHQFIYEVRPTNER